MKEKGINHYVNMETYRYSILSFDEMINNI